MKFIRENWIYYVFYLLVLSVASYYLVTIEKLVLHQNINSIVGNRIWDTFNMYFTHVGDGVFAIVITIIVMYFNIKKAVYVFSSYILAGGLTAILKNFVFSDNRPHHVFGYHYKEIKIKYIEGVEMIGENSFPSGHATAAFAVFTALALLTKNPILKLICLVIAVNAAFSRTYLSQHWLIDIYTGSIIGVLITTILYFVFMRNGFLEKFNKPLLNRQK
jgi:membrane-associated phospholipid phosphatase